MLDSWVSVQRIVFPKRMGKFIEWLEQMSTVLKFPYYQPIQQ